jgi:peptidoglycan hydrolase-like protein with peptidoglycan-binding domain
MHLHPMVPGLAGKRLKMAYKEIKHFHSDNLPFMWNVSKPVGLSMANEKGDVALVQMLLVTCYDQGNVTQLKVDGACGPKTRQAIKKFQTEYSIHSTANGLLPLEIDGIVSHADNFGFDTASGVTAYTIVALNWTAYTYELHKWLNLAYDPAVPPYLRAQLRNGGS